MTTQETAEAFADLHIATVRARVVDRHKHLPLALDPLTDQEWLLLRNLIVLGHIRGEVQGKADTQLRIADALEALQSTPEAADAQG